MLDPARNSVGIQRVDCCKNLHDEKIICIVGELAAREDAPDSVSLLISEAALDADIARVEKEFKPKCAWV